MLKKERRISREYLKSLEKPIFFLNNGTLSVRVFENKDKGLCSKFSFSISKKIEKTAVVRNKMRRLGYDIVKEYMDSVKDGFFLKFVFNSTYKDGIESYIKREILDMLNKAKLLKN